MTPGHYCAGWNVGNGVTLNLSPGVYYLGSESTTGVFSIQGGAHINGPSGVTLVFVDIANPNIANGTVVTLVAPTLGPFSGLSITTNSDAPSYGYGVGNNTFEIGGGTTLTFTGAIHMPYTKLQIDNGSTFQSASGSSGCGQVIADTIVMGGGISIGNNCQNLGLPGFGTSIVTSSTTATGGAKLSE